MTDDLATVPKINVIRVAPDAPLQDIRRALMLRARLKEIVAQAVEEIEHDATEWIKANHPVEIGDTFYWVGKTKPTPKCVDIPGALDAALRAAGGDEGAVIRMLVANPIKYGAFWNIVGEEEFAKYFRTEEPDDKLESGTQKECKKKLKSAPAYMMK